MKDFQTYEELKEYFFKKLTKSLKKKIEKCDYNEEKPLDVLLNQLTNDGLFQYIWKDAYLQEYVFSVQDQRISLWKTYYLAKEIVASKKLKKEYIDSHDEQVRFNYEKFSNDYNFLKGRN